MPVLTENQNRFNTASSLVLSLIAALVVLVVPAQGPAAVALDGPIVYNDGICQLSWAYQGTGAINDPYQISDSESLWEMADCSLTGSPPVPAYFYIINQIDASEATAGVPTHSPIGHVSSSLAYSFSGIVEGGNHTISVSMSTDHGVGLFAYLHSASIQNLEIAGSFTTTTAAINDQSHASGGLAIRSLGSTALVGVVNSATVIGRENVGGLIGSAAQGLTLDESSNVADISGGICVGGLVGFGSNAFVKDASNTGAVTGLDTQSSLDESAHIGGLIGCAEEPTVITDSVNSGPVSGSQQVGGLIGRTFAGPGGVTVSGSINTGEIISGTYAGGLVGFVADDVVVISSNNSGTVSAMVGDFSGGLVGFTQDKLTIRFSTNQGAITGARDFTGGLAGSVEGVLLVSFSKNFGYVTGQIRTAGTAGFVGEESNLLEVENHGDIQGTAAVGGFIGWASQSAVIGYSNNEGNVTGVSGVGGFIGDARSNSVIEGSDNLGEVSASSLVGGFVGQAKGLLTLYALDNTGKISGGSKVGGLLGSGVSVEASYVNNKATVSGEAQIGGLIGYLTSPSLIDSSFNDGDITGSGSSVGGLLGQGVGSPADIVSSSLRVLDSDNFGDVTGTSNTAGLVGNLSMGSEFSFVRNTGTIRGSSNTGGLVGDLYVSSSISNANNEGEVFASGGNVGGIAGNTSIGSSHVLFLVVNSGDVTAAGGSVAGIFGRLDVSEGFVTASQVLNDASITGADNVGGLFGLVQDPLTLQDSVNIGTITGVDNVGGLVGSTGQNGLTALVNSYFAGTVSGTSKVDGLVGSESGSVTVISSYTIVPSIYVATSTIAQMQSRALYVGWDFNDTWGFGYCDLTGGLPIWRFGLDGLVSTGCASEVTNPGPSPQAPTPSYNGPTILAKVSGEAGAMVILRGTMLNLVTAISAGTLQVEVVSRSAESLTFFIPAALSPGFQDLVVESTLGRVTFISALEILSSSSTAPSLQAPSRWAGKTWVVPGSRLGSIEPSSAQRSWMKSKFKGSDSKRVVCTAVVGDQMTTHQRILVRKAAKVACENIATHLQSPSIWVKSKKSKHTSFIGKVLLTVKG